MPDSGAYSHQSEIPASDNRIEEPGLTDRAVQFRRFVDERMAAQGIASLVELADISDVGRDTLYAWFRGRTPTPRAGGRVARSLGVSYRELLDAFESKEKGEADADLASALRDLADAIRGQSLLLAALADVQGQQSVHVHSNSDRIESLAAVLERLIAQGAPASSTPGPRRARAE